MNQRIEKLAEQALENSLFETIGPTITVGEGENKVTIPLVFAEKFAELVIAECAASYHQTRPAGEPIETFFRKHLGVE
jgi:hypothetical protein